MSEDLGTEEVANGVGQITSEYPHQRRDASDNLGLQDHKVDQPPKQGEASFGAGRSTVEHSFDCRVIFHNFTDFKKALDRVCHDSLWKIRIGGTIDGGFIKVIQALRDHPITEFFSEQSTLSRGKIFLASRRRQIGVFTFPCSVQCLARENHTWDHQQTAHRHVNWWLARL